MHLNTVIIGAGPAGIAAAIQLKRSGIDFSIIEKNRVGGLIANANMVENYPGLYENPTGVEIVNRFESQLDKLGIHIIKDEVNLLDTGYVITATQNRYTATNVIVASGTRPKTLDRNIFEGFGPGQIYYEVSSMPDIKNNHIAVIGGGDAAFDYALNLAKNNKVSIFFRSNTPKCLPLLHERAKKNKNIEIYPNTDFTLPLVTCHAPPVTRILVAIGREPATDFFSSAIKNHFLEKRPVKGLYFAGDVARGNLRQMAIAVGDGVRVAMEIIHEGF